ncbi:response regulator [Paenibacillus hexagrammi]|uniref:Response regulator n=1 Tax=Paenibacillus hexagrammi TaxID=2908839 RepID=A0ABY3SLC1_9BACL|nr:response regulator [Paenibacillus sp. YPD9-1]UJF33981.1 response regulator [Paenibacillus sp. YPD9-1]
MLRAIIVDDEELSVKLLNNFLSGNGEIEVCHTFHHSLEAYEYVKSNPIHVAFLDISMPGIDGMGLSSLLHDLDPSIDVVFVTAHDDYAVRAFDMSALDYIMKPVDPQRLAKTLDKIRKKHRGGAAGSLMEPEQVKKLSRLIADGLAKLGVLNDSGGSAAIDRALAPKPAEDAPVEPLTAREAEILQELSRGCPIAKSRSVSESRRRRSKAMCSASMASSG